MRSLLHLLAVLMALQCLCLRADAALVEEFRIRDSSFVSVDPGSAIITDPFLTVTSNFIAQPPNESCLVEDGGDFDDADVLGYWINGSALRFNPGAKEQVPRSATWNSPTPSISPVQTFPSPSAKNVAPESPRAILLVCGISAAFAMSWHHLRLRDPADD